MRPFLITNATPLRCPGGPLTPLFVELADSYVMGPSTDGQEAYQPLGVQGPLANNPPPSPATKLMAPEFLPRVAAARGWEAQRHLRGAGVFPERLATAFGPGWRWSQELQPIKNKEVLTAKTFAAVISNAGDSLNRVRVSQIPSGQYADFKCRILNEVQRHLLEPVVDDGLTWQLWTTEEVHEALELRLQRFLVETGMLREEATGASPNAAAIPQDALDVRRVEWRDGTASRGLFRMDAKVADLGFPGWDSTTGSPVGYIEEPSVESMELKVCPPAASGSVSMRYVPAPSLHEGVPCEPMPIPRMFTWVVKWGLIADLLKKEGEANDPVRAGAAQNIYDMGVRLAKFLLGTSL